MSAYSALILGPPVPLVYPRLGDASGATIAVDASGNGRHGTPFDVSFGRPGLLTGDADTAATFNGSSSYIAIPSDPAFNVTSGTIACWFRTSSSGGLRELMRRDGDTSNRNWLLRVDTGNKLHGLLIFGSYPGVVSAVTVNDGVARLASMTWAYNATTNSTSVTLFLNGVSVGTASTSGAMPAVTTPLHIGAHRSAASTTVESFLGTLDEPAFWAAAFTADEHLALYTTGTTAPTSLLLRRRRAS